MSTATSRRTRKTVATVPTQAVTDTVGAASYGRISSDPGHDQKGVARQTGKNLARISAEPSWHHAGTFVDNDLSATKENVVRPEFEKLLQAVGRGDVRVIVVYMSGRLLRNARDRLRVRELFTEHGVKIVCTDGQDHDYATPSGRMIAGIMGEVDEHETAQLAQRIRDEKAQAAGEGRSSGARAYGYRPDPLAPKHHKKRLIVPEEAAVIREAKDRILKGDSLGSIVRDLNERGVKPLYADFWSPPTLREIMTNPTIAGRRVSGTDDRGRPVDVGQADWPPVVDYADHLRIVELLSGTRKPDGWSNKIVHLLSGIVLCGKCASGACGCVGNRDGKGHRVAVVGHAKTEFRNRPVPRHYKCQDPPRGCRGVRRDADFLDDLVEQTVLSMLAEPGAADALVVAGSPDAQALLEVQRQIDSCEARARVIGVERADIDPADEVARMVNRAAEDKLKVDLDGLRRRQAQMSRSSVVAGMPDLDDLTEHWPTLALMQKRAVVSALVEVTILPSGRGKRGGVESVRIERKVV